MRVRFVLIVIIIFLLSVSLVSAQESRNWKNFPGMGVAQNGMNCADALKDYGITTTTDPFGLGYFPFYRSSSEGNWPTASGYQADKSIYICAAAGDHNPPSEIIAWNGGPFDSPAAVFPAWEGDYCDIQQDAINPAILNGDNTIACYSSGSFNQYADYRCNDGIDNDGDSLIDMADSGCTDATDDSEGVESCTGDTIRVHRVSENTGSAAPYEFPFHSCQDGDWVNECFKGGTDPNDAACCPTGDTYCVYNGVCYLAYDHYDLGSGEDSNDIYCGTGSWATQDSGHSRPELYCGDDGAYHWVYAGESGVGEYDSLSRKECCGDDDGEHYAPYCPGVSSGGRKCCSSSNDRINSDGDCVNINDCDFCHGNWPFSGDYSDIDVLKKHSVEWLVAGGTISTSYDDCNPSNNRLTEYYCSGIERKSTSRDCTETNSAGNDINAPTGAVCYDDSAHSSTRDTCVCPDGEQWLSDRRCGKPCTDDNDDDKYLTQESISYKFVGDSGPTKTDECTSYSDVKEYFCTSDTSYSSVTKNCNYINAESEEVDYETGAMCGGGKCVCPSGEEWLSDGTCGIPCTESQVGTKFFQGKIEGTDNVVFRVDRFGKIVLDGAIIPSSTGPTGSFKMKTGSGFTMVAFDSSGNIHVPGTWSQRVNDIDNIASEGFTIRGAKDMIIASDGFIYTEGCVHQYKGSTLSGDGAYKCRDYYRTHSGDADSLCPKLSESFLEVVNGYNQY